MTTSNVISFSALLLSALSFLVSLLINLKLRVENRRYRAAIFQIDRNVTFEGKLFECTAGFEIQGVDLDTAQAEGIRQDHIAYLVMSFNALSSIAISKGETVYDHLKKSSYRRQMFSSEITRKAWKYARLFFTEFSQTGVDRYLREEFPDNP